MDNPLDNEEGRAAIARRLDGVSSATLQDYIDDAWARALSIAPCIGLPSFEEDSAKVSQLVAILRAIILRWHETQSGALTGKTQMAGPYQQSIQMDSRPRRGFSLLQIETLDLQRLCARPGRAFSFGTVPEDLESLIPLYGVVVNGDTETLNGPPGEWSEEAYHATG